MKPLPLLVLSMLAGCSAASDPYAPRAGQWEVTTSFVSIKGEGITQDRVAELHDAFPKPEVGKMCFDGRPVQVGMVEAGTGCVVTRVSDEGAKVDREIKCKGKGKEGEVTTRFRGSHGPDRYDHRISSTSADARTRKPVTVVMREVGRRIGDCET